MDVIVVLEGGKCNQQSEVNTFGAVILLLVNVAQLTSHTQFLP